MKLKIRNEDRPAVKRALRRGKVKAKVKGSVTDVLGNAEKAKAKVELP